MFNKSELEWLERNRKIIDNRDEPKIYSVLPVGDSRIKMTVMLALFMDKNFEICEKIVNPKLKIFRLAIYTDLFSNKILHLIESRECLYSGDHPSEEEMSKMTRELLEYVGIPNGFIDELLRKSAFVSEN